MSPVLRIISLVAFAITCFFTPLALADDMGAEPIVVQETPPPAEEEEEPGFSAFGDFYGGGSGLNSDDAISNTEDDHYGVLGGGIHMNAPLAELFDVQLDFAGEWTSVGDSTPTGSPVFDGYKGAVGGGGHFGWVADWGGFGVFAQASRVYFENSTAANPDGNHTTAVVAGGEFIGYYDIAGLDSTTLVQAGYVGAHNHPNAIQKGGWGRVLQRFFPLADLKTEIGVSYARGTMDHGLGSTIDDVDIVGWEGRAEYRLGDIPLSVFADYTGAWYQQHVENDHVTQHTMVIGLRVYFGQDTLLSNDRTGVRFDVPRYERWVGITGGVLE